LEVIRLENAWKKKCPKCEKIIYISQNFKKFIMTTKEYIHLERFINFINACDSNELVSSLNELDTKIKEIFIRKEADIDSFIVNILSDKVSKLGERGSYF
jgi:hypothetical protein